MEILMKDKLVNKIEEDALLREVVEDVKNEQFQQWWNKYGIFVIIGVALVLTITISFESIKNWQIKKHQEVSDAYSVALSLQNQGRLDESLEIYNTLAKKSSGIYADISKLQIAAIYTEQDKFDDAMLIIEKLAKEGDFSQIRNIAILKLASYKLDKNAPADEISELLKPLVSDEVNSPMAHELMAMLYVRENDKTKALAEYEKIQYSMSAPDNMKARAQDMMGILSE